MIQYRQEKKKDTKKDPSVTSTKIRFTSYKATNQLNLYVEVKPLYILLDILYPK